MKVWQGQTVDLLKNGESTTTCYHEYKNDRLADRQQFAEKPPLVAKQLWRHSKIDYIIYSRAGSRDLPREGECTDQRSKLKLLWRARS
jgi:hypothetical protein